MLYIYILTGLFLLFCGIRLIAKLEHQLDDLDTFIYDVIILAEIVDMEDRSRRVQEFTKRLVDTDSNYRDLDNEMCARITWYLLAVDSLNQINPDYGILAREAKEVTVHNLLGFQSKLHELVRVELEAISNQHQKV